MAYWYIPSRGFVSDAEEGLHIPEYGSLQLPDGSLIEWGEQGTYQVPEYTIREQFGTQPVPWSAQGIGTQDLMRDYATGYLPTLLNMRASAAAGTLNDADRAYYDRLVAEAMAVPMRDVSGLTYNAGQQTPTTLHGGSPDLGAIMLSIADRMQAGTATAQERELYRTTDQALREQDWKASVPQESDANPFGLGDNLFGALAILGSGATAGLAAAPLFAGGAGLATTLGSLGTLAGTAGGWAGTIGGATGQDWLATLGKAVGAAGGIAGGIGGLSSLFGSGVTSLADAARLASNAGRITGAVGTAAQSPALRQAASYLSAAGNVGRLGSGVQGLLGAAQTATDTAQQITQAATGGPMSEWDYSWDYGGGTPYDNWSWDAGATTPDYFQSDAYRAFTGWGDPSGPGSSGDASLGGWNSILGSLGGLVSGAGSFLGNNSSWLGPAVSGLAGLGTGLLGSNASSNAAAAQTAALNRAIDLQQANWLMQQARTAPWVEAGQQALGQLQGMVGQPQPTMGQLAALNPADYRAGLPGATPGWSPQSYAGYTPTDVPSAAGYRYTPGQGPQAANYRYTPGAIPDADQFAYRPGAVPTLSGAELLANDPGVAFRLAEGRKALEASAAARGGLTSGATLAALQRQGQELSSAEYANAWNRASQQAQMREQWAQQASQMGFGQQMSEAQLREQVNQIASQQGWTQAQAEAAFREQLAQQAGAQNWQQALQEAQARAQQQQFGWQSGFQAQQQGQREQQQYDTELYQRMMGLNQLGYSRDLQANDTAYQRMVDQYNALRQGQNTAWNQYSTLAGYGPTALSQLGATGQASQTQMNSLLGQLGSAQGLGSLGPALSWQNALTGGAGAFQNLLKGLNA